MTDFFADLAERYAPSPDQEARRLASIRSAVLSGTFAEGKLYNDAQMDSLSRRYGLTVYDFAVQAMEKWDDASVGQRQAWESWAETQGWKPGDRTPTRLRLWHFPAYSGEWMQLGLNPPYTGPRAARNLVVERTTRTAPTMPVVDDQVTGRTAGQDYHAA